MQNKIKHICFDLDGTLVDSHKTIYNSTIKSLKDLKITNTIDEEKFRTKIGMHFVDIFEDMNVPVKDFDEFIGIYKNNYFLFIDDSELYPSVLNVLGLLFRKKIKISLLTTKAQDQAEKILEHFQILYFFDLVMGRRNGIQHKPSAEPLLMICKELDVEPQESLIIGDTELDILCGKNANVRTCAITHGYRSEKELFTYNPDYIIQNLNDIKKLLTK